MADDDGEIGASSQHSSDEGADRSPPSLGVAWLGGESPPNFHGFFSTAGVQEGRLLDFINLFHKISLSCLIDSFRLRPRPFFSLRAGS